jgi:preprotein translocase subunit SecA
MSNLQKRLNPELFQDRSEKVARNSTCPCGRGKKYKKCCERRGLEVRGEWG